MQSMFPSACVSAPHTQLRSASSDLTRPCLMFTEYCTHEAHGSVQCWNELFELFDYSNSWDRIVVFSIPIRSFSGFRILFELFE